MTYDCGEMFGGLITNYCVHFVSRRPTMDENVLQDLIKMANNMGLNPENIPFDRISHDGC